MAMDDVFGKINHEYYQLTSAEKKIADYMMLYQQDCQYLSISRLADRAGVAEATVSRYCRRLGYRSYSDFKLAMAGSAAGHVPSNPLGGEVLPEDSVMVMCEKLCTNNVEAVTQTFSLVKPELITAAADILTKAGKVLCMGQGGSMILAREAAHLFSTALPNFFAVEDSHIQVIRAASLRENDAVLYFSYSGSTKDMADTLEIVRSRGGSSILITRFPNSQGAQLSDIVLECGSHENPLQLGSVAARMAQLYLVDVLFSEVCRRDLDGCRARRKQVADVLTSKHM